MQEVLATPPAQAPVMDVVPPRPVAPPAPMQSPSPSPTQTAPLNQSAAVSQQKSAQPKKVKRDSTAPVGSIVCAIVVFVVLSVVAYMAYSGK
ncbi:MAG: hypothetical protein WBP03_02650 [Candidatus Saccharimonadales bacterium]|jgi:hypothetical protein